MKKVNNILIFVLKTILFPVNTPLADEPIISKEDIEKAKKAKKSIVDNKKTVKK